MTLRAIHKIIANHCKFTMFFYSYNQKNPAEKKRSQANQLIGLPKIDTPLSNRFHDFSKKEFIVFRAFLCIQVFALQNIEPKHMIAKGKSAKTLGFHRFLADTDRAHPPKYWFLQQRIATIRRPLQALGPVFHLIKTIKLRCDPKRQHPLWHRRCDELKLLNSMQRHRNTWATSTLNIIRAKRCNQNSLLVTPKESIPNTDVQLTWNPKGERSSAISRYWRRT